MSITLKAQVTFGLTIVVMAETLKFVADARSEVKAMTPEKVAEKLKDATGEERFKFELFASDKTDEEVIEVIYRASMRGFLREELKSQLCNSESRARIGNIKVDFEKHYDSLCAECGTTDCVGVHLPEFDSDPSVVGE